jgi:hypothetical protein
VWDSAADGDVNIRDDQWEVVEALIEIGVQAIKHGQPWEGPLPPQIGAHARRAAAAGLSMAGVLDRCMAECRNHQWHSGWTNSAEASLSQSEPPYAWWANKNHWVRDRSNEPTCYGI